MMPDVDRTTIRSENLLLIFSNGLGDEIREDVRLSTWAAERHAVQKHGRLENNPHEWVNTFLAVLNHLGWVTCTSNFQSMKQEQESGTAQSEVLPELFGRGQTTERLMSELGDRESPAATPRWFGMVTQEDGQAVMRGVVFFTDSSESSGEEPSGITKSATSFEVQYWEGILNDTLFRAVKKTLQDRYDAGLAL